jgi:hypothetical protein
MFAVCRLLISQELRMKDFCLTGIAVGLALSIRVGAFLLFFFLVAGIILKLWLRIKKEGWNSRLLDFHRVTALSIRIALLAVIAWFIMVLFWPWTHTDPIGRPLEAFQKITAFPSVYPVLFEGRYFSSNQLPWYYLPKYLLITTPPLILVFFIIGLGVVISQQFRNPGEEKSLVICLLGLWFFFPLVYVMYRRPNIYDGIRHFLFILPAMAAIAGIGATTIRNTLARRFANPWLITVLVIIMAGQTLGDIITLHPYQMTYFNIFTGGTTKADGRYETDYWVSSYKEGAEWINKQAAKAPEKKITLVLVANNYFRECAEYYLDPRVKVFTVWPNNNHTPKAFNYVMSTTRYGAHNLFSSLPVVHIIGRQGAAFTIIRAGPGFVNKPLS